MSMEIYRRIPDYPNYAVSTWGRVINIETGYVMYQEETKKGYLRVKLPNKNGADKHIKVHRLVAEAFIPNPDRKSQVNHIDGNKKNNSYTNLEWVSDAENKQRRSELLDMSFMPCAADVLGRIAEEMRRNG